MNRRERRAAIRKGAAPKTEPVYHLTRDQIIKAAIEGPGREALEKEINRQILERQRQYGIDTDVSMIWVLYQKYGFGPKRLKELYQAMLKEYLRMRQHYEIRELYPERMKLKERGIDVEAWYDELFDASGCFRDSDGVLNTDEV